MVEGNIVRALSYLSELFEQALARPFELSALDSEVVIDQIDFAGRHTTAALFALRPDIRALHQDERGDILDSLFEEHCLVVEEDVEPHYLVTFAWNELNEAFALRRCEEIDMALAHLDVVSFVLDPDLYHRSMAEASPSERIQLASQLECVELMLEESRDALRGGALMN